MDFTWFYNIWISYRLGMMKVTKKGCCTGCSTCNMWFWMYYIINIYMWLYMALKVLPWHAVPRTSSTARSPTEASTLTRLWPMVLLCRQESWAAKVDTTWSCWMWLLWPWALRLWEAGDVDFGGVNLVRWVMLTQHCARCSTNTACNRSPGVGSVR